MERVKTLTDRVMYAANSLVSFQSYVRKKFSSRLAKQVDRIAHLSKHRAYRFLDHLVGPSVFGGQFS